MRFDALHLTAVGPFTDRTLDLSAGKEGVHVIYGRNEAGKSSSLRAVRALLFGFEKNTTDNFVHNYAQLRVGADVRVSDGSKFVCYRRKGNKDTLLDADGKVVSDERLGLLLRGMSENEFIHLFGIDHRSLVEGGHELLKTHGREAEALFSSGIGSSALPRVRKSLADESAALFSGRGVRPAINALGRELDELRKAEREATLLASRWDDARREVERVTRELDGIDGELRAARSRHRVLDRLRRILPLITKRAELLGKLEMLGDVVALSDDFSARREHAEEQRRAALQEHAGAEARLARARQTNAALVVDDVLLAREEAIEALHARSGINAKAAGDRRGLARDGERLLEQLSERQALLGGARAIEELERALLLQPRLQALIAEKQAREERVELMQKQLEDAAASRARQQRELDTLLQAGDVTACPVALREAVHVARPAAEIDSQLTSRRVAIRTLERKCSEALSALGRWQGGEDALLRAPMPDEDSIVALQEQFAAFDERARRIASQCTELLDRRAAERDRLGALLADGDVPSQDELAQRRARRELGWRLLRAQWVDGEDVSVAAREFRGDDSLPDAYERAVHDADGVADRLWAHAAKVQDVESSKRALDEIALQLQKAEQRGREIGEERLQLQQCWIGLWQPVGLDPGPPGEMLRWSRSARELRELIRSLRDRQDEFEVLQGSRAQLVDGLRAALRESLPAESSPGESAPTRASAALSGILARAERQLVLIDDRAREKSALIKTVAKLGEDEMHAAARLKAASDALSSWRKQWEELATLLGVARSGEPAELAAHVRTMHEIVALSKEHKKLVQRIMDIDIDRSQYEADALALCCEIAPGLAELAADEAVRRLQTRLRDQQERHTRREGLTEQARKAEQERDAAAAKLRAAQMSIEQLCVEAGGVSADALVPMERAYAQRRQFDQELARCEQELYTAGDGEKLDDLLAAANDADVDAVAEELSVLGQRIEQELQPRRDELVERKLNAQRVFDDMLGDGDAADLALQVQQKMAEIREKAGTYVRLKLASRILTEQVESFRAAHRDPILAAAGRYLETLTNGAYIAVRTQFDSADQALLCALRADTGNDAGDGSVKGGARLTVDALSTGTRDQLFLALRLAALERYLDGSAESLPLMVDDILVQFDDERAHATLKALAEFATRTQVLLFTHHERIAHDALTLEHHGGGMYVHYL